MEHIADAGLLGGSDSPSFQFTAAGREQRAGGNSGDRGEVPSLDPVPQELTAVIEARFTASGVTLAEPGPLARG